MTQEYSNKGTKKYFGNTKDKNYRKSNQDVKIQKQNGLEESANEEAIFVEPNPIMFLTSVFSEINRIYKKFTN